MIRSASAARWCIAVIKHLIELRAFLTRTRVAARVEPLPQIGIVRQKIEFRAVARFRHFFPVANLVEPVQFIQALQHGLVGHPVHFFAAQEIPAPLHHRHFQPRREMFLEKRNVLFVKLLLQGFCGRGNHHGAPAADRGDQVRQRFPRAGAGLDDQVALFA